MRHRQLVLFDVFKDTFTIVRAIQSIVPNTPKDSQNFSPGDYYTLTFLLKLLMKGRNKDGKMFVQSCIRSMVLPNLDYETEEKLCKKFDLKLNQ